MAKNREEPPSIPQQHDLQKNLGIVGYPPRLVVSIFLFKTRRIQTRFYQGMNGELQDPGHQLVCQRHWQKHPLPIIICLEFCHVPLRLVFSKLSRKHTNIQRLWYVRRFLWLNWLLIETYSKEGNLAEFKPFSTVSHDRWQPAKCRDSQAKNDGVFCHWQFDRL